MADHKVVGTSVPRGEGGDKVSGQTVYAADVKLSGLLWAKILRSPHPHARIRRRRYIEGARKLPGVCAIITGADVEGLSDRQTNSRYAGVCAGTRCVLSAIGWRRWRRKPWTPPKRRFSLIEVDYELLPAVFDPLEAMAPGAPTLHENVADYDGAPEKILATDLHNGLTRLAMAKRRRRERFSRCRSGHGAYFHYSRAPSGLSRTARGDRGDRARRAHSSLVFGEKSLRRAQPACRNAWSIAEERICMNPVNVGGEFGGKGDGVDLPVLYFLAQKTGRPVKIVMTYAEELSASNPAHPTVITIRTGVKRDGPHRGAQDARGTRERRLRRAQIQ